MDLIRKISGLRSSHDLSAAVQQSNKNNEAVNLWDAVSSDREDRKEEKEDVNKLLQEDPEEDDGDVFEDAAPALGEKRPQVSSEGKQQQQQQRAPAPAPTPADAAESPPVRIRAPVSLDEVEEEEDELDDEDDEDIVRGVEEDEEEEEEVEEEGVEEGAEDGHPSRGSAESFDSALERMAASSEASYDTAVSPKMSSPVGSLQTPAFGLGTAPPDLSPAQQGALLRLNEMITGDSSLDISVIENSTGEQFKSRVLELAEKRGSSLDDHSFASIIDALLPLVLENSPEPKVTKSAEGDDVRSVGASVGAKSEGSNQGPQSPMPKAKLTADDEDLEASDEEDGVEDGPVENGADDADEREPEEKEAAQIAQQPEIAQREASPGVSGAVKVNSVPNANGGHPIEGQSDEQQLSQSPPMPMAKLSAEDEDDREEDELSEHEDDIEEPVEEPKKDQPLKIRALPSDIDESVLLPILGYLPSPRPEENGDNDENVPPAKVPSEASQGKESSEEAPEIQIERRPSANLSDDDTGSSPDHSEEKPFSSDPQVAYKEAPQEEDKPLSYDPQVASEEAPQEEKKSTISDPQVASKESPQEESMVAGIPEGSSEVQPSETPVVQEDRKVEETAEVPPESSREASQFLINLDDGDDDDGEEDEDDEEDQRIYIEGSEALAAFLRSADSAASESGSGEAVAPSGSAGPSLDDEILAQLFKRATSSSGAGGAEAPRSLGSAGPSLPERPTRAVRSSLPSLEPASRAAPRTFESAALRASAEESPAQSEPDGNEETREKLQQIRVKFLRLALRLGQSPHNVVVAQVLYRLGLAEQLRGGARSTRSGFSFDNASALAEEQERAGPQELDFDCTIMILGKTGVGKSATINSIFDEAKTGTNAFSPSTKKVQMITGLVHGIKVRVIDTPGLLPSVADQRHNEKIMNSVKGFVKNQSPDIVLYFDRLDMQSRDYGDLPLLRTITDAFGAGVWFNAIVVLTHSSSAPPDSPNGLPFSYEQFVHQRSLAVQQTIRQAAGDMRLMNPVALVENHSACRKNRDGERVLPNGQVWKPHLLLLCFASKILAQANSLLKLQENIPGRIFSPQGSRVPPLPFLLSSLLQSRAPMKMPDDQGGEEDESDDDLDEEDESDDEEDYDQLPPFRRLANEEVAELDEDNRAKYFEELAERERLFQKKIWKEELKRRRDNKRRMAEAPLGESQFVVEDGVEEEQRSAAVPVTMPDLVLPPSFDSENPSHRYRYLETANQWLVRPVLETHGWDHDNGYDGMSVEKMFVVRDKIPASVSGQITKDKKEANLNMECAASLTHRDGSTTLAGLDVQTVGKDLGYTVRSETRFSNFKGNKTTGGLSLTLLNDTISPGLKLEDRLIIGKQVKVVVNGGIIYGAGDVAYGGSMEATLRDKEFPLSRTVSTLGVSVMDWHGDVAVGGNLQSQFVVGKTMVVGRANLNNRGSGQISIRASSSEQLQMALIGILPIVRAIVNRLFFPQSQQ